MNDDVENKDVPEQSQSEGIMIPTKSGKKCLLMLDSYTYSQINYSANWCCSSKRQGCTARLRRTHVRFIPTERGKYILVLKGYTYSQVGGRFFYCSSKHTGCRARVRLISGQLVVSGDKHNHPRPSHARCGNGAFVPLRPRSEVLSPTPTILPSPLSSPSVAALALQALGFPRLLPKTDMWLRTPNPEEVKKDL
ncbi:unnamed protein product [Diatraea saccharalis]|uniref:FLYWCH-type domain-containing protein n=1 Tax=Diatraea saccharalis TaxID=40085 RepID=A0A9N9R0W5_9NEOP|nr:unnamed protein product [Diatraea saccharalis]